MDKKNRQLAERNVLWSGVDDWTGLWEVVWEFQTLWPELKGEPATKLAHEVLKDLLVRGLVYLCLFDADTNREQPLSKQEALVLMTRPDAWEPPDSFKGRFCFASTKAGEEEMLRLEKAGVGSP